MAVEHFNNLWINNKNKDIKRQKIYWDQKADSFNQSTFLKHKHSVKNDVMEYLIKKDAVNENSRILDIGCGVGNYSIEFAKIAKEVVAIDISPRMLDFARVNAKKEGLSNVSFNLLSWGDISLENLDFLKSFDLVFASKCPGINSLETLEKVTLASKKHCFINNFVEKEEVVLQNLYKEVFKKDMENEYKDSAYFAFSILWELGYFPELTYLDFVQEKKYMLEEAINLYTKELNTKYDIKNPYYIVREYLEDISDGEFIEEVVNAKVANLYWTVD